MDRPFSTPGGGQVALLALSATLPRGTRLCFERRHSALLRRARRASEFYLLHRRGTRVFVFHCAHPRSGCGHCPRLAAGRSRSWPCLRHCRGTRDLVTHSTTARLGSADSPPHKQKRDRIDYAVPFGLYNGGARLTGWGALDPDWLSPRREWPFPPGAAGVP